jgi:hypothetical protein
LAAAVAAQSATAPIDERIGGPVSTKGSAHAEGASIAVVLLGLGLVGGLVFALAGGGGGNGGGCPAHAAAAGAAGSCPVSAQ